MDLEPISKPAPAATAAFRRFAFVGVLKRVLRNQAGHWSVVAIYLAVLFFTLPWVPDLEEVARRSATGLHFVRYGACYLCAGLFAWVALRAQRPLTRARILVLCTAIGITALLLLVLDDPPIERVHLPEYGILAGMLLAALGAEEGPRSALLLAWALASAVGMADEVLQLFLPTRVFDWRDVLVNVVSAGLGAAGGWVLGWTRVSGAAGSLK